MTTAHLKCYETGWDHGLIETPSGTQFEAHAPSRIELRIVNSGTIRIRGSVRHGGAEHSSYKIILNATAKSVAPNETNALAVQGGDVLLLMIHAEPKDRCWTSWQIEGLKVIPREMAVLGSKRALHLGDALGILIGLDNYNLLNGANIAVAPLDIFRSLIDCFDFTTIKIVEHEPTFLVEDFFWSLPWTGFWPERVVRGLASLLGGISGNCRLPECKVILRTEREDIVLCQFDSRSAAPLHPAEIKNALDILAAGRKVAVLGGHDTRHYLGDSFEYRLDTLDGILRQLQRCHHFVGVDSGIAHLAGVLGVPAFVINLIDFAVVFSFFGQYKNTVIVDRRILQLTREEEDVKALQT
jgi:hypothetical protein